MQNGRLRINHPSRDLDNLWQMSKRQIFTFQKMLKQKFDRQCTGGQIGGVGVCEWGDFGGMIDTFD